MSLDLSYNRITSLAEMTDVLSKLPKLRTLTLIGNPVSVSCSETTRENCTCTVMACSNPDLLYCQVLSVYRPFVISTVPQLTHLDEVQILADDHTLCSNFSSSIGTLYKLNGSCAG